MTASPSTLNSVQNLGPTRRLFHLAEVRHAAAAAAARALAARVAPAWAEAARMAHRTRTEPLVASHPIGGRAQPTATTSHQIAVLKESTPLDLELDCRWP